MAAPLDLQGAGSLDSNEVLPSSTNIARRLRSRTCEHAYAEPRPSSATAS